MANVPPISFPGCSRNTQVIQPLKSNLSFAAIRWLASRIGVPPPTVQNLDPKEGGMDGQEA